MRRNHENNEAQAGEDEAGQGVDAGQHGLRADEVQGGETKAENDGEVRYLESSVLKIVKDKDGNETEVMSDHLAPGERLKRDVEAEKAEAALKARAEANKEQGK